MPQPGRVGGTHAALGAMLLASMTAAVATQTTEVPNPYRVEEGWAKMPAGRTWGSTSAVEPDRAGNIWVGERCGANSCADSTLAPILQFDRTGMLIKSFGEGTLLFPHGFHVDPDGNIWVTDARGAAGKGHQVLKFSPQGKLLLALGKPGVAGDGPDTFNQPSDVVVAANGDIFVADGHDAGSNARIVKFTKEGRFIKSWGKRGAAHGEFDTPHAIAIDSKGRVFVGDRGNNRIQIFDQEGTHLATWTQFGRPSGVFFDHLDRIIVADSESDDIENPGWDMGIRIGDAATGALNEFVLYPWGDPRVRAGNGAEFAVVDRDGNIYGGEPRPRRLQKYVRVRP